MPVGHLAFDQSRVRSESPYGVETLGTAVDAFHSRIDNLEESVQLMINRFIALSAATEIPAAYRRG